MFITVFSNLVNVFLNWLLIWGMWGFPEMGMNGAAWATLISRVLMMVLMAAYVLYTKRFAQYQLRFFKVRFSRPMLARILKIGVPTGFQFIFEVSAFSAAAIMMGWIGVNALAGHQIALNLASISYMMATGVATAGMIRVSHFIGKGNLVSMKEAGRVAFGMVAAFMFVCALLFFAFRFYLPTLYIDDPEVICLAASLLILAGFLQISEGVEVVGGEARGLRRPAPPPRRARGSERAWDARGPPAAARAPERGAAPGVQGRRDPLAPRPARPGRHGSQGPDPRPPPRSTTPPAPSSANAKAWTGAEGPQA
jgi:MATE family multidrug resistance protein